MWGSTVVGGEEGKGKLNKGISLKWSLSLPTVKITAYNHIVGCEGKSRFYSLRINENNK